MRDDFRPMSNSMFIGTKIEYQGQEAETEQYAMVCLDHRRRVTKLIEFTETIRDIGPIVPEKGKLTNNQQVLNGQFKLG